MIFLGVDSYLVILCRLEHDRLDAVEGFFVGEVNAGIGLRHPMHGLLNADQLRAWLCPLVCEHDVWVCVRIFVLDLRDELVYGLQARRMGVAVHVFGGLQLGAF